MKFSSIPLSVRSLYACAVFTLLSAAPGYGQSTWTGGNAPLNWSNAANWSGGVPSDSAVIFGAGGLAASGATSIVDQNFSITSLSFNYVDASNRHTLQINDGQTLTQSGAFTLGSSSPGLSRLIVQGDGSWVVNAPSSNFSLSNTSTGTSPERVADLDMSGLASFSANVSQFNLGYHTGNNQTRALVKMAESSEVTANYFRFAAGGNNVGASGAVLSFGAYTELNVNTLLWVGGRNSATVNFQNAGSDLIIRDQSGSGRANLYMGVNVTSGNAQYGATSGGSSSGLSTVNLNNSNVDFLLNELALGVSQTSDPGNGIGYGRGVLSFNQGVIDANAVVLGRLLNVTQADNGAAGNQANADHGVINMGGGTLRAGTIILGDNQDGFGDTPGTTDRQGNSAGLLNLSGGSIEVAGDVILGQHTHVSPSGGHARGTLNLTGGTLTVGGDIKEGDVGNNIGIVTLAGATLDMTGGNINAGTFNAGSGTLMNVGEINGGVGGLQVAGNGVDYLVLEGVNTYTGGTTITSSLLRVGNGGTSGNLGEGDVTLVFGSALEFNRSDEMVVHQKLIGGSFGNIIQAGSGKTILTGNNTATSLYSVNNGILQVNSAASLQGRLQVSTGGTFRFLPAASGTGETLLLREVGGNLTLENGSTIGVMLGSTVSAGGQSASVTGTVNVELFGNPNTPNNEAPTGIFDLITANGGLDSASYDLLIYNATNFEVTSFSSSATAVSVEVAAATALDEVYWLGGQVSGNGNVWAISGWNGTNQISNWASNEEGDVTALAPGANTDVIFSATGAQFENTMTLGGDMTVKSLRVNAGHGVTLVGDPLYRLTLGGDQAVTMDAGSGTSVFGGRIRLDGAAPVIANNGSNSLVFSGVLEGENGMIQQGGGIVRFQGDQANTLTGAVTVESGTLELAKEQGVDAIADELAVGAAGEVILNNHDQINDAANVSVTTGGVFDLNGYNESVGALTGDGLVTNTAAATTSVFSVSGNATGADFSGLLQNGGVDAILALVKTGSGIQILSNSGNNYSGGTTVEDGILRMGANGALGVGALTMSGVDAVLDMNGFSHTASSVLLDGGSIIGENSVLTSSSTFQMQAGEVEVALAGSAGLSKTTDGLVVLSGDNTYTGGTSLTGFGVLRLEHDNALGATGAGNGTTINGDVANGVTLELSNGITVSEDVILGARQGATAQMAALRNHSGNNTWAGNITFTTGGSFYNVESAADLFTISGNISAGALTGTRVLRLYGDGDGEVTGSIINAVTVSKEGSGTWTFSGSNTYTGSTSVVDGTLIIDTEEALPTGGNVILGGGATAGTLVFDGFSKTIGSLTVESNTWGSLDLVSGVTTNANKVILNNGETLTVTGNLTVGPIASSSNNNTSSSLVFEGGGHLVVNNPGGEIRLGRATGASITGQALLDLRRLQSFTADLGDGHVHIGAGDNRTNSSSYLYLAEDSTITASSIRVGGSPSSAVQHLILGSGENVFNVDSFEVGTGTRDWGWVRFDDGDVTGSISIQSRTGGRADFYVSSEGGATGAGGPGSIFDVRGHQANMLLDDFNMANQSRGNAVVADFYFDTGTLDMNSLNLATRGIFQSEFGATEPRSTIGTINLGGGQTIIREGITAFGRVTGGTAGASSVDPTKARIADAVLNIYGDAIVDVHASGSGPAISMAGATKLTNEGVGGDAIATGTINLEDDAQLTVHGDIVREGGTGTTSGTINLGDNATLDMTGHSIGSATLDIALNAMSGKLRNLGELNGGGDLVKTSGGTLLLEGLNTYNGHTQVNEGIVQVTHTNAISESSGVTVANGAAFHFSRTTAGHNLQLDSLNLLDGSTIGVSVGNLINVTGIATATGTITVDIFGVSGLVPTDPIQVIRGGAGSTLNEASAWQVGNYFNVTNFTVDNVFAEADGVWLNVSAEEELDEAWWKGGYGGGLGNVWAVTNAVNLSNWTEDEAGMDNTPLIPGSLTVVNFSADGAQNQQAMQLGAHMSIGSLVFRDSESDVSLEDMTYSLSLNLQRAIEVTADSSEVTLNTNLLLTHLTPEIFVESGELLQIGGVLGGNAPTKLGGGTLLLNGSLANDYSGIFKVQGGLVQLNKTPGVNAIVNGLEITNASVTLLASDQIEDSAIVTVGSNGFFNLNSHNETVGGIEGTGTVRNLADGTTSVITVGAGDVSSEFAGVLANGGAAPTLEVVKTGEGTWTLSGTDANTYSGMTSVFGGILQLNKSDGVNAIRAGLTVGNGVDPAIVRWLASNQLGDDESNVVLRDAAQLDLNGFNETIRSIVMHGGQVNGATSILTATQNFDLRDGEVNARLAGDVDLVKSTTGEVLLAGQNLYTGVTRILGGVLKVGVDDALPTGGNVEFGDGTTTGTLDLNGFDQTVNTMNVSVGSGHQLIITAGNTLTQNGAFSFGGTSGDGSFVATGGGEWIINTTDSFNVSNTGSNNTLSFDVSGLSSFEVTVDEFNLGSATGSQTRVPAKLADNNVITANVMRVGAGGNTGTYSGTDLEFGQTNVLNVNNIVWGTRRSQMTASFRDGLIDPTLVIRGRDGGTSRANLTLGVNAVPASVPGADATGSSSPEATVDMRGGVVDWRLDNLQLAVSGRADPNNGIGYGLATLSFDQGTIDVTNVVVGRLLDIATERILPPPASNGWPGPNANATHAVINMEGGVLTAENVIIADNQDGSNGDPTGYTTINGNIKGVMNISGGDATVSNDIIIAAHTHPTSPSSGYADGALNLTGGSLTVGGNITEGIDTSDNIDAGENRSYVLLDGATLDMTGGEINVDTFETQSGTLKNVEQIFNGAMVAADLVKTGVDKRLVLEGVNNYTGATLVQQGNLQVGRLGDGTTGTAAVSVADTAALSGSGIVRGNASFASGATLMPGDDGGAGLAQLTFEGSLNMADGSNTIMQLGGASYNFGADFATAMMSTPGLTFETWVLDQGEAFDAYTGNHDYLDVQGELTFEGSLRVENLSGYQAGYGDVFNLVDWVLGGQLDLNFGSEMQVAGGQFNELTLPDFGDSGLLWDLSLLNSHGILTVVPEPSRAFLLIVGVLYAFGRRRRR